MRKYNQKSKLEMNLVLEVFFIGGLYSTFIAGYVNGISESIFDVIFNNYYLFNIVHAFQVGFSEEFLKMIFTILLIRKMSRVINPLEGIVLGMAAGLGFSFYENIGYMLRYGADVLIIRSYLSVPGHMVFAAVWGYGLYNIKYMFFKSKDNKKFYIEIIPYYFVGSVFHGIYDLVLFLNIGIDWIIYPLLIVLVVFIRKEFKKDILSPEKKSAIYIKRNIKKFGKKCEGCGELAMSSDKYCRICGKEFGG